MNTILCAHGALICGHITLLHGANEVDDDDLASLVTLAPDLFADATLVEVNPVTDVADLPEPYELYEVGQMTTKEVREALSGPAGNDLAWLKSARTAELEGRSRMSTS